uniref:Thioredoxin domain-containing protein n=1 Tax=Glossina pallidipes TaxID=7398 RepID=A0A1A9ZLV0_GLOPL
MTYSVQSKEDMEKQINEAGDKLIVIDFYASWCGPCKIISPKLEELSVQYSDKALVLKVNVDDCEEIALEYNVTSMPTFVFMKNRQIIDIFVGGNPEKLVKNMEKYVGGEPLPIYVDNPIESDDLEEEQLETAMEPAPIEATVEDQQQVIN